VKIHLVTCSGCGREFDYAATPETAMGAAACPHCGATVNQTGAVLDTSRASMTELFLYGSIGQSSGNVARISAAKFLDALGAVPAAEDVTLRINSDGGSVTEATAIFNAVRNRGNVDTQIDGIAASAAAYIAMAGRKVRMAGNAMLMIHKASTAAQGTADQLRREADVVDLFNSTLIPAFAARTGKSREEMDALMSKDAYFTASQALALGFVDEVTGDLALAACIDTPKADMSDPITITAEEKSFITNLREFFTGKGAPADPVAVLRAELNIRNGELARLQSAVSEVIASRDTALAQVGELAAARDEALAKIIAPEVIEAKIAEQVTQRLAEAGPAPIARDPLATAKTEPKPEASGVSGMARARAYLAGRMPAAPGTN